MHFILLRGVDLAGVPVDRCDIIVPVLLSLIVCSSEFEGVNTQSAWGIAL